MSKNSLPVGNLQFYSHYLTTTDNDYRITVTPKLTEITVDNKNDLNPVNQYFTVTGPRFSLPSEDIHAQSPAPQSTGQFDTHLPHIIFNKRALPWERNLSSSSSEIKTPVPWLALLVFSEEELSTVSQFAGVVNDLFSEESLVLKPQLALQSSDQPENPCSFIRIPVALFTAIAPRIQELEYLAHCRDINNSLSDTGSFAVVVANRFPQPGKDQKPTKNSVHLVSLEGCQTYLDPATIPAPADAKTIQLVSLANWSFQCSAEIAVQETFQGIITQIIDESTPQSAVDWLDPKLPLLRRLPGKLDQASLNDPDTLSRLGQGYVPLQYHLRTGENTLGWYRGPLTPEPVEALDCLSQTDPLHSDALLIYEAGTGIFDVSYAAAWQLGRSLALADPDFAQQLVTYRWRVHHQTDLLIYRQRRRDQLGIDAKISARHHTFNLVKGGLLREINQLTTHPQEHKQVRRGNSYPIKLNLRQRQQQRRKLLSTCYEQPGLTEITQWLQKLRQELSVPFEYLVADKAMLPNESVRFFHVDPNWLGALTLGALSIGIHTMDDQKLNAELLKQWDKSKTFVNTDPVCGMLLRSTIVSGWPGLTLQLNNGNSPAPQVRQQKRLSSEVLLCFWSDLPNAVAFCEPHEQLCFGVEGDEISEGFISLRAINGVNLGKIISGQTSPIPYRDNSQRVLDFTQLNSSLVKTLGEQGEQPADGKNLNSAEMAIELIRAPLKAQFLPLPNSIKYAQPHTKKISLPTEEKKADKRKKKQPSRLSNVSDSPPMSYQFSSVPYPIQTSSSNQSRFCNLTFVVNSSNPSQFTYLQSIEISIPVGDQAQDFTNDAAGIQYIVEDSTNTFQISSPYSGNFLITPKSGSIAPMCESGFSVYLYNIIVNQQPGNCDISILDITTDSNGDNALKTYSNIMISKFPGSFSLYGFMASKNNILPGDSVTLSWYVENVPGSKETLSWYEYPSGLDVTNQTSYDVTLKVTTTYSLSAYYLSQKYSLQLTVTVCLPEVLKKISIPEINDIVVSFSFDAINNYLYLGTSSKETDNTGSIWIIDVNTFNIVPPSPIQTCTAGLLTLNITRNPLYYVYVAAIGLSNVVEIAIEGLSTTSNTISIGTQSIYGMVLDAVNSLLYVASYDSTFAIFITIIDSKTFTILSLLHQTQLFVCFLDLLLSGRWLAIDVTHNHLYFSCCDLPLIPVKGPHIGVMDTNTFVILPQRFTEDAGAIALDTVNNRLYVSGLKNISVIDTRTLTILYNINHPGYSFLTIDTVNKYLYVMAGNNHISIMDTTQNNSIFNDFDVGTSVNINSLILDTAKNYLYACGNYPPIEILVIGNQIISKAKLDNVIKSGGFLETKTIPSSKNIQRTPVRSAFNGTGKDKEKKSYLSSRQLYSPVITAEDFSPISLSSSSSSYSRSASSSTMSSVELKSTKVNKKSILQPTTTYDETVHIHILSEEKTVLPSLPPLQMTSQNSHPIEVKNNHRSVLSGVSRYLLVTNILRTGAHIGLLGTIAARSWEEKSSLLNSMAIVEAGYGGMTLIGLATRSLCLRNRSTRPSQSLHPTSWVLVVALAATASALLFRDPDSDVFSSIGIVFTGIGALLAMITSCTEVSQVSSPSQGGFFYRPISSSTNTTERIDLKAVALHSIRRDL